MAEETDALVGAWVMASKEAKEWRERVGRIEWELTRMMQADGATALSHPSYEVKLTYRPTYDYTKLAGLRELVPEAELGRSYTPEHEETVTVPARWDMRKALTLKKFGAGVAELLERARVMGEPKISIKSKGGESHDN
jgi:hypothetical protein